MFKPETHTQTFFKNVSCSGPGWWKHEGKEPLSTSFIYDVEIGNIATNFHPNFLTIWVYST